jgi:hypothetical protein
MALRLLQDLARDLDRYGAGLESDPAPGGIAGADGPAQGDRAAPWQGAGGTLIELRDRLRE